MKLLEFYEHVQFSLEIVLIFCLFALFRLGIVHILLYYLLFLSFSSFLALFRLQLTLNDVSGGVKGASTPQFQGTRIRHAPYYALSLR